MSAEYESRLLIGEAAKDKLYMNTSDFVERAEKKNIRPCLATLRVGDREDDKAYSSSIESVCERLRIKYRAETLPDDSPPKVIAKKIRDLGRERSVHGLMLFRPLPENIKEQILLDLIPPQKDVDGSSSAAMASMYNRGSRTYSVITPQPCTAQAVIELLGSYDIEIRGKRAVVIGRSTVIGKPVAHLLLANNATVTICHSKTEDLSELTRAADIVVVCAGLAKDRASRLSAEYFSPGQAVIDVGIHVDERGMYGDVDTEAALSVGASCSPVPGGLGKVTTAVLTNHVARAAIKHPNI